MPDFAARPCLPDQVLSRAGAEHKRPAAAMWRVITAPKPSHRGQGGGGHGALDRSIQLGMRPGLPVEGAQRAAAGAIWRVPVQVQSVCALAEPGEALGRWGREIAASSHEAAAAGRARGPGVRGGGDAEGACSAKIRKGVTDASGKWIRKSIRPVTRREVPGIDGARWLCAACWRATQRVDGSALQAMFGSAVRFCPLGVALRHQRSADPLQRARRARKMRPVMRAMRAPGSGRRRRAAPRGRRWARLPPRRRRRRPHEHQRPHAPPGLRHFNTHGMASGPVVARYEDWQASNAQLLAADPEQLALGRWVFPASGAPRARSHCRFTTAHFIPHSLTYSVPLYLKRQCDRTLGAPDLAGRALLLRRPAVAGGKGKGKDGTKGKQGEKGKSKGKGNVPPPPPPPPPPAAAATAQLAAIAGVGAGPVANAWPLPVAPTAWLRCSRRQTLAAVSTASAWPATSGGRSR